MTAISTGSTENDIRIVSIDSPPVNALGHEVRDAIVSAIRAAIADPAIHVIVLMCGGRTFFAGADIAELGKPPMAPTLHEMLDVIESSTKPIIAAMHGTALGGGLETALACDYRVAVSSTKFGLPEVALGILPGAGGTQRLPRLIDVEMALDLILTGRQIGAKAAQEIGLIDLIAKEGNLRADAVGYARTLVDRKAPLRKVRDLRDKVAAAQTKPDLFAAARAKNARLHPGFKAPRFIVSAVEAAIERPFDAGLKFERELLQELLAGSESKAQRYAFFAERATAKVPDLPQDTATLPINRVGVIGAGTMGGGIAMNFLNIGIPVTIVEVAQDALDRGIAVIRKNYDNSAKKGRLTADEVAKRMSLLTGTIGFGALADEDLIIEAVFENMEIKKQIFTKLDAIAKPDAILASNTSFLNLDEIAGVTRRPAQVIGLHFFSPANVMKLLEVVRGKHTSKVLIATALKLAKRIGKIPVVAQVCRGFIANRAMAARGAQADQLVLEGASPGSVDRVLTDYGFAMGHFAMIDLVGLDVIKGDPSQRTARSELVALGRLGQKKNGGYYDYDENRTPTPSAVALEVIAKLARDKAIPQRSFTDDEIRARLLYPVINECARILEEGIAIRPSDIDTAMIAGYNWPVFSGGPMFWADQVGLGSVVAKLKEFQATHGDDFHPAALLEIMVAQGKKFSDLSQ
jgi:3-hydroxyacyl-CoA dehydrogenase